MFDVMLVIAFCTGVSGIVMVIMYIFNSELEVSWVAGLILVVITLVLYVTIEMNVRPENFIIDRNMVGIKKLKFKQIEMVFSDTLDVEVIEYSVPLSTFWDYKVYRIYIDSLTYIEIIPDQYDSLDIHIGKKLFKE